MSTLTIVLLSILGGALLGGGGVLGVQALGNDDVPATVAATATVVEAAVAEDVTDAETRQAVATSPAVNLAVAAAVEPGADARTYALASYALCLAAAQGKVEGSAAFGCQERGRVLDAALGVAP